MNHDLIVLYPNSVIMNSIIKRFHCRRVNFNPCLAEFRYTLPLQAVYIQISWLLKKPIGLDLHCHLISM